MTLKLNMANNKEFGWLTENVFAMGRLEAHLKTTIICTLTLGLH